MRSSIQRSAEAVGERATDRLVVSEDEAAKMVNLAPRTLAGLRVKGGGPVFVRLTGRRIGYAVTALHEWVERRSTASTSAASVAERGR